jgi:hypothetical protein
MHTLEIKLKKRNIYGPAKRANFVQN